MEVLTGDQMRRVDRHAIETLGIPGIDLMEAAGRGVANAVLRDNPNLVARGIVILCGKGNNGGDGFVAARHLATQGVKPRILLFGDPEALSGDAATSYGKAISSGLSVETILDPAVWAELAGSILSPPVLVLDALLGTGVRGGARGLLKDVIESLNLAGLEIASVDLPSGLDGDSFRVPGAAVRADRTYTLCRPKLPLVTGESAELAGSLEIIPIGIPDRSVDTVDSRVEWLQSTDLGHLLPARQRSAHKGTYGHLLAIAGSRGKGGAAVLLARAALRCGTGLVTVATPESVRAEVAAQQAEIMTEALHENNDGTVAAESFSHILALLEGRDALALGPGIGTESGTCAAVMDLIDRIDSSTVIDADGLNILALGGDESLGKIASANCHMVLTPHPGEAARLLGSTVREIQDDRLAAAASLSGRSGAVVILKGHRTVVASPNGGISINSTGNPGMATAGTGDVLTGMIGAFLARGMAGWDAARLAVFLHGRAGDLAERVFGQEGLISADVIERIPLAISMLTGSRESGCWTICQTDGDMTSATVDRECREDG